jgi:excisionase family DNA binding protein
MHPNADGPPKLAYSIREAVTATSLSKTTLYAKIAANELRAIRVGGRTLIPAHALHALIYGEG